MKPKDIEEHLQDENSLIPEDDAPLNLFLGCYWKKRHLQTENGDFNYASIITLVRYLQKATYGGAFNSEFVGYNLASEIVENCEKIDFASANPHGKKVAIMYNCLIKNLRELVPQIVE